ncbi:TraM recognition domain-containing protein, partial [bacterium]|nr:TraM recognition domain-containing protein [bacterium]
MSEENKKSDMSFEQFIASMGTIFAGLGALWFYKNENMIRKFYFLNYEKIYMGLWVLLLAILALVVVFIKRKTKDLKKRADLMSQVWTDEGHDCILTGTTTDEIDVFLNNEDRCSHVQIIGSTGRGKTQSVIIPWAVRDLKNANAIVVIDGKGGNEIPRILRSEAPKVMTSMLHFDLGNVDTSIRINPLSVGSPQQITDRIFRSFNFDDTYYKSVQYDICSKIAQLISEVDDNVTFRTIHQCLSDDQKLLEKMSQSKDSFLFDKLRVYLKEPKRDRDQKLSGLLSQLSPFAEGEISPLVNGADDSGLDYVSISDFVTGGKLNLERYFQPIRALVISIPTLKYQEIGHQLGKLILQEIAHAVSVRENIEPNNYVFCYLDEFSEFVYSGFISVLNKARSAKVGFHLSHQSLGDLGQVSQDFAKSINANTNIKCILGVNDPDTADFFARHIGTEISEKNTEQMEDQGVLSGGKKKTGMMSMREVDVYKIHPNELKSFSP